jgi:hypothetical protein
MLKETLIAYCKWFAISLQVCGRDFRNGIYDYSYSNSSNIHHSLNCEHFTEKKKHILIKVSIVSQDGLKSFRL